jgi:hypothetical protein
MANKLQKIGGNKWPGIYAYESATRKHQGKSDLCYYYTFKIDDEKYKAPENCLGVLVYQLHTVILYCLIFLPHRDKQVV